MKKVCPIAVSIFILPILLIYLPIYSQTFTKITAGDIVNDGGRSGGSSWIDYDKDGWLDLFVANGNQSDQNNFLYRNNREGSFVKITSGGIVTDGGSSIGGTWGDYDNDGDPDLFVTNRALTSGASTINFFYRNAGDGSFDRITSGEIANDVSDSNISSWIDIENDGDLDLLVVNFGQSNFLYLSNEDGTFTKSTSSVISQSSLSISAVWGDYNNDGYLDLFIGNGGSQANFLFRNNRDGSFTQITSGAVVTDIASSTGCSWGDFNNDGNLDLIVANFLGTDNFLYRNDGPPNYTFTKITTGSIVNDGGNSVGSAWGDLDNDGDLDLFIGNDNQNNFLYRNNGDGTFEKLAVGEIVNDIGRTFGVSMADYDRDGDLDIYATNIQDQNNFFYSNNGNAHNWVSIKCVGTTSNKSAIGTKVKIKAMVDNAEIWQMREIASQSGYNSQNSPSTTFGLKDATAIDSVLIEWPSGILDVYTNLATNMFYSAAEGDTITIEEIITAIHDRQDTLPEGFVLYQNYPNPFNPSTQISFGLPQATEIELTIYNIQGQKVKTLANEFQLAGQKSYAWKGLDDLGVEVASGVYFFQLKARGVQETKKMILMR